MNFRCIVIPGGGTAPQISRSASALTNIALAAIMGLGNVLRRRGDVDGVIALLEPVTKKVPRIARAHNNLATVFEEEGKGEWALRHYKTALREDPFFPDTHVSLALLYERLELRRKAKDHWRRYLQLEPSGAWSEVARKRLDG